MTLTNEQLAGDVTALALGLGLKVSMRESDATLNGRIVSRRWRITWTSILPVARLARKAERLRRAVPPRASRRYILSVTPVASRPVKCISVDAHDQLFLAGENYIATHNSVLYDQILERLGEAGLRVHSYINEMSKRERMDRTVARLSGVPFEKVYTRRLDAKEEVAVRGCLTRVQFGITECAGWTAPEIARHIRWNRWDVAGVDIVHEIAHREERDLAEIAQVLRAAAKQADCILVACVHLNDNRVTAPQRPIPVMRDVRGSGMLVRGADIVLLVHRDDDENGIPQPEGAIFAAKIRNGQPAAMGVMFDPSRMRFLPVDRPASASSTGSEW